MSMQALLSASQAMARMQTMQSSQAQMQSTANILRIESKQDGGNEKKLAAADALEKKSHSLQGDLMGEINDINETLRPDEEAKPEDKQEEQNTDINKRADSVSLSEIASGYHGDTKTPPVMGDAVVYDAGGSKTPSIPAKSAPTIEVTV